MAFTHVGMYQGRVACADIAAHPAKADYTAIPRVVFCDPEIAAVGLTEQQARKIKEVPRHIKPYSRIRGEPGQQQVCARRGKQRLVTRASALGRVQRAL